jgi:hypothetical protein
VSGAASRTTDTAHRSSLVGRLGVVQPDVFPQIGNQTRIANTAVFQRTIFVLHSSNNIMPKTFKCRVFQLRIRRKIRFQSHFSAHVSPLPSPSNPQVTGRFYLPDTWRRESKYAPRFFHLSKDDSAHSPLQARRGK